MDLQLTGKRVLVTGSTGGIGEGIAKGFAQEGATVIINGRREAEAQRVAAEITSDGGRAIVAVGDLSTDEGVDRVLSVITQELGGLDVLVNNAAGGEHQNDMEAPASVWLSSYNSNVLSMVRLIQQVLPKMKEQGWGRIINISSAAAIQPSPGMGVYSTTKAAVNNLTVTLAQSMDSDKITINAVSPGAIITPAMVEMAQQQGMANTWEEAETTFATMMPQTFPFKRMGKVNEIANVVLFLASPLANYIHGANIRVDGGYIPTIC
ncbi:MAG: short-chain dehydrogenase [Anaerolineaceae bacterium]|nr:short-chain dehydrogenase [Anaerolineaceae bacterium]